MMSVMIPVYILNALYLGPLTLWTYVKWGRPPKPGQEPSNEAHHHPDHEVLEGSPAMEDSKMDNEKMGHGDMNHSQMDHSNMDHSHMQHDQKRASGKISHAHMHGASANVPMFATVTVAVCHCGSGCLLGDLIGEWIVFGTGAMINGKEIWVEFLLDYAFALIIGILFQYWSIAPMTGDYGINSIIRAAKADFLSLTFFEIGLFGWMAIFQLAIFKEKLPMDGVVYWWMMQIGMFLGHWTAFPINWWLITSEIKERGV